MPVNLSTLNPPQREAAETITGPLLVLAGAGTGKTRVITYRMAHMLDRGIPPGQILAMTFTNKAAREMKDRFVELVKRSHPGKPDLEKAARWSTFAGTFHSFCVKLLRKHIGKLGISEKFTIYDDSDSNSLVRKILAQTVGKSEKIDIPQLRSLISLSKNKGVPLFSITGDDLISQVATRLEHDMRLLNALDFDDLLIYGRDLLASHPDVREEVRAQFRYILVDEYQDTNHLQFELLKLMVSVENNVCVVGDDDQSIYSWRGAESGHILEFDKNFPGAKIVKLEQNYRSTPRILNAANQVIKNNARRRGKKLWSSAEPGEKIRVVVAPDGDGEAEWVLDEITRIHSARQCEWEHFAILYRTNTLSRPFEQQFRQFRIPYKVIGGMSFFERREIKDLLAYLKVILNPTDDISLLRVINCPPRGIGDTTVSVLQDDAIQAKQPLWNTLLKGETAFSKKAKEASAAFVSLIQKFHIKFVSSRKWADAFKELIEEIDYRSEVRRGSKDGEEEMRRWENVRGLADSIEAIEKDPRSTLEDFIDNTLLDPEDDKDKEKELQKKGVTLMSLHAAKGLEFPHVFMVCMEEGIIPHDKSALEDRIDEERRLFYVGITRAMKTLTLTRAGQRKKWGDTAYVRPSPFLEELPPDEVEQIDVLDTKKEIDHVSAAACLDDILARLE